MVYKGVRGSPYKSLFCPPPPRPPALGANPSITNNATVSCFVHNIIIFLYLEGFSFSSSLCLSLCSLVMCNKEFNVIEGGPVM